MKIPYLLMLPLLACAGYVHADVYKRVDADGNVTYSNRPIKGGKKIELAPLPIARSGDVRDSSYERVQKSTQRSRDDTRRKVLEDELAAEEKLLAEARQNLQDAQGKPRAPAPDAAQDGEVRAAQEQVDLHERNVKALKQELASLK